MALIKCPECGHEISEYADKCVSCGCPMSKIKELKIDVSLPTFSLVSKSATFKKMTNGDKVLVNDICNFILSATSLVLIDHSKNFGFRKYGSVKMVIVFRLSETSRTLYIVFRTKTELPSNKIKVKKSNIEKIKNIILKCYSDNIDTSLTKTFVKEKESVKNKKDKPESFRLMRTDYENRLIKSFEENLKAKIRDLIIKDNLYTYSFRISKGQEQFSLCWFSNGEKNKLAFKYYLKPLTRESPKVLYPTLKDTDTLVEMILKTYSKLLRAGTIGVFESNKNEFDELKSIKVERIPIIYKLIVSALHDKTMVGGDDMTKVCNEVKSLVLSEIMYKGIEENYFKNEEEFNQFKYSYRFVPNFFGYKFTLKNINPNDAKIFYSFYKATKLIGVIRQYEKIFNLMIIEDYSSVLHDYQKMLVNNEVNYFLSKGLTSSFNLVPLEALDDCLDKLNGLENIF